MGFPVEKDWVDIRTMPEFPQFQKDFRKGNYVGCSLQKYLNKHKISQEDKAFGLVSASTVEYLVVCWSGVCTVWWFVLRSQSISKFIDDFKYTLSWCFLLFEYCVSPWSFDTNHVFQVPVLLFTTVARPRLTSETLVFSDDGIARSKSTGHSGLTLVAFEKI